MLIKNDLKANIESRPRVDIACDKTLNCRILLCPITSSAKEHYKRQSVHYEQLDMGSTKVSCIKVILIL